MFWNIQKCNVKINLVLKVLNVAGISEEKENFTHQLVRLISGPRDHPDESSQLIVNNTCRVTYAVILAKLVSQSVHFHANNNFL